MMDQSAYTLIKLFSFFMLFIQSESRVRLAKIADGSDAAIGEFPFQVSFQIKSDENRHYCGGSIVHESFILTTAHCVNGRDLKDIRIVAGITNLKKIVSTVETRNIANKFSNPNYHRPLPKDNDISLIKVDRPFIFNGYINQVDLPSPTYQITAGQEVYVSGWGLKKALNKSPTNKLKKTKVKVFDHAECEKKYRGKLVVGNTIFCTIHTRILPINRGVCNGDSGGPVTINKTTLVGVIKGSYHGSPTDSARPACGSKDFPDLHKDVAKYREWIDTTIANNA